MQARAQVGQAARRGQEDGIALAEHRLDGRKRRREPGFEGRRQVLVDPLTGAQGGAPLDERILGPQGRRHAREQQSFAQAIG